MPLVPPLDMELTDGSSPGGLARGLAIYVDHTCRFAHNTGIQRCVRATARALMELGVPLQPLVWDRDRAGFALANEAQRQHLGRFGGPDPEGWSDVLEPSWLLVIELVRGDQNPAASALRAASCARGCRVAWVVHDTLPLRWDPDPVRTDHQRYLRGLALFDLLLANSRATANELRQLLTAWSLPLPAIVALPLAEALPAPSSPLDVQQPDPAGLSLPTDLNLLCVSSLEPRKNHLGLLKAVTWLAAQERLPAELTLVGWPHDPQVVALVERAMALDLPLRWLQGLEDDELAALYRRADVCLYPSLEEGFGLPVAEALHHQKPCLCSGAGALGELAAGGGCLTVNTADWRQLSQALERLLGEPELRAHLSRCAQQRPQRSWHVYAQELINQLSNASTTR